jgi:hypothetical protein
MCPSRPPLVPKINSVSPGKDVITGAANASCNDDDQLRHEYRKYARLLIRDEKRLEYGNTLNTLHIDSLLINALLKFDSGIPHLLFP